MRHLILIYGLSGSGKSTAARILEDVGVRVVRNFPPTLISDVQKKMRDEDELGFRLAIFPEILSEEDVTQCIAGVKETSERGCRTTEIFLDASDEVLLNRYKESRRPHPLRAGIGVLDSIHIERNLLVPLRRRSELLIHTDTLDVIEMSSVLLNGLGVSTKRKLTVSFLSFGFKYGVPAEVDLCFDVRFLDNPFFVDSLKDLSGVDEAVKEFVLGMTETKMFVENLERFLQSLLPLYIREGKHYLTVGIGCTGGRHRSVVIADELLRRCRGESLNASSLHRDINRKTLSQKMNGV